VLDRERDHRLAVVDIAHVGARAAHGEALGAQLVRRRFEPVELAAREDRRAPKRPIARASVRPMPVPPPVMSTDLPASRSGAKEVAASVIDAPPAGGRPRAESDRGPHEAQPLDGHAAHEV
jgi:hypothetical protein